MRIKLSYLYNFPFLIAINVLYKLRLDGEDGFMIQHFKFKPLYENKQLPGWSLTFFYKQQRYNAEYLKDGTIKYIGQAPAEADLNEINQAVHGLMLFHVYD